MPPPLSYTSQTGYYGLRVNPSFEQVLGTVRKPLRIPLPDRRAKWYALSPYRALILDAEQKYNNFQHAVLDYRDTGAQLPEAAAMVRPSDAGQDQTFDILDRQTNAMNEQSAYESAFDAAHTAQQAETNTIRSRQLRDTYGPNKMHPVVEAMHDELEAAAAPHYMPKPRFTPAPQGWKSAAPQMAAAGQPQAPEFPSFQALNMGQLNVRAAALKPSENLSYERAREFVVQPTWSS